MKCQVCDKELKAYQKKTCSNKCSKKIMDTWREEYKMMKFEESLLKVIKSNVLSRETLGPTTRYLDELAEYLHHTKEQGIQEILRFTSKHD